MSSHDRWTNSVREAPGSRCGGVGEHGGSAPRTGGQRTEKKQGASTARTGGPDMEDACRGPRRPVRSSHMKAVKRALCAVAWESKPHLPLSVRSEQAVCSRTSLPGTRTAGVGARPPFCCEATHGSRVILASAARGASLSHGVVETGGRSRNLACEQPAHKGVRASEASVVPARSFRMGERDGAGDSLSSHGKRSISSLWASGRPRRRRPVPCVVCSGDDMLTVLGAGGSLPCAAVPGFAGCRATPSVHVSSRRGLAPGASAV
jgi:hypothetical protein